MGMATGSTPIRWYTGSALCSSQVVTAPPTRAIHNACRTTSPDSPVRPPPCNCDTDGVMDMTMPDNSSIDGQ